VGVGRGISVGGIDGTAVGVAVGGVVGVGGTVEAVGVSVAVEAVVVAMRVEETAVPDCGVQAASSTRKQLYMKMKRLKNRIGDMRTL
jgi:class 3 adenylate cyclase